MFFYVSFLRPPPTRASLSNPILVTPQVANDLQTEFCDTDQDIYFDWVLADPKPSGTNGPVRAFKKPTTKLMTWRGSNAYKEIPVPPPYGAREGQQWRLVLSALPAKHPASIQIQPASRIRLDDENLGRWYPFSVVSMPVSFTSNARHVKGVPKQEQIERSYQFEMNERGAVASGPSVDVAHGIDQPKYFQVERSLVELLIREQTSFGLDKKIWDSGIGLSAWLVQWISGKVPDKYLNASLNSLRDILESPCSLRVLELGAGTGIVALILAALRSRAANAEDRLLTTDLESAIPLLQHNIDVNEPTRSPSISLTCGVLDWEQDLSEQLPDQEGFDLVVMADVTYNTASFPALVRTLERLRSRDGSKKLCFLLGYKERDEAERTLWDMAEAIGIKFVQAGSIAGHVSGGAPIEIWVG